MTMKRRSFLYQSTMAGGALALHSLMARAESASSFDSLIATKESGAYGPLQPAKSDNADLAFLALPAGFHYTILGRTGKKMTDSYLTPRAHDGMAAFRHKGKIRLVRNHEINNRVGKPGACIGNKDHAYDPLAGGGTSTLVIDPKTREIISDFVSLCGTLQNCAGGPTPWGSWITCEETILGKAALKTQEGETVGQFEQNHGYCFEVPAFSDRPVAPVPLKAMGRFVHEAIAVDPKSGIVYLTEDAGSAGFYRFLPKRKGRLAEGGQLQMLAVKSNPEYDTRRGQKVGTKLSAVWVDIANPDPEEANRDSLAVFKQGKAKGGATFARLEGCWYGDKRIFFTATSGGDKRVGQVWEYRPEGKTEGTLHLIFESPGPEILDMPDNITVSPRGGLVICEDGSNDNYIRGITRDGRIFDFAKNIVPGFGRAEFAGATFSPDGQTLFVNIQTPGITLAIWGPWKDGAL